MPVDHIRYDILVQDALRGMVRHVLTSAAKDGLPGDHHFFITFDTTAEGVELSERLRERYPEEMTIVLQHQFWDLKVGHEQFEVGLSFSGIAERLVVPLAAIKAFTDPSVQFSLQFETLDDADNDADDAAAATSEPTKVGAASAPRGSVPASPQPSDDTAASPDAPRDGAPDKPGAEVVRLDRFRKK